MPKRCLWILLLIPLLLSSRAQGKQSLGQQSLVREGCSRTRPAVDAAAGSSVAKGGPFKPYMEMDSQGGGCGCSFFDLGCWWNCVWGGSTGGGGNPPPSLDPCQRCKDDANRAYKGCIGQCSPLVVNTMAYHDCQVECGNHKRDDYVNCSLPDGGPCNDVSYP
jgi:hypothetical protein